MNAIRHNFFSGSASYESEKGTREEPTQKGQHQNDRSTPVYDTHRKRQRGKRTKKTPRIGGKKFKLRSTKQFDEFHQLGGGQQEILQG